MNDTKQIKDTIDRVESLAQVFVDEFDEQFHGTPFGLHALKADQHILWYEENVAKYPPEVFVVSLKGLDSEAKARLRKLLGREPVEGEYVVGSAWTLMLPLTENGEAETRRYLREKTDVLGGG